MKMMKILEMSSNNDMLGFVFAIINLYGTALTAVIYFLFAVVSIYMFGFDLET